MLWGRYVGILVLLLLAAWMIAFGPAVVQSVGTVSPIDSEKMFQRALRAISNRRKPVGARSILVPPKPAYPPSEAGGTGGMRPVAPKPSNATMRRRRNLTYLAMFIVATFLLGLIPSLRFLLVINLVADVLLILYLAAAMYLAVWPPSSEARPPEHNEQEPSSAASEVEAG